MSGYTHEITLNSGYRMPLVGLGTWLAKPGEVGQSVEMAIRAGYKHIDCAYLYGNQKEIGAALKKLVPKVVTRKDLFVTSKVFNHQHSYNEALNCINETLRDLQLFYLDLMLIHFPHALQEGEGMQPLNEDGTLKFSDIDYLETYRALEDAHRAGKVRSIGISNFNHSQIQRVLDNCTIKPAVLQIELNPYLPQKKLLAFCKENGIAVTAYNSLTNPGSNLRAEGDGQPFLLEEPLLKEIGEKYDKSPAQVALRWAVQQDVMVIPKSLSADRIKQNGDIFNFTLSDADMDQIATLENGFRLVHLREYYGNHPDYPFHAEY